MTLVGTDLSTNERLGLYGKAFAGAAVATMSAYSTAVQDGSGVSAAEWLAIAVSFLASFGIIWAIPNTPRLAAAYGKLIFAGLAAGLSTLGTGLVDGSLTQVEMFSALAAALVAGGLTGTVSNAASSDPTDPVTGRLVAIPGVVKDQMSTGSTTVIRTGDIIAADVDAVDIK